MGRKQVLLSDGNYVDAVALVDQSGAQIGSVATPVDRSGTIAAANTSQQVMAANANRRYMFIQNVSVGDLWLNFGVAAVAGQPSIRLSPGDAWEMMGDVVFSSAVNVLGATVAQAFTAKEV